MKKHLLLFLSFISLLAVSQDYQSVNSGNVAYFQKQAYARAISIDSVKIQGTDSILYPNKMVQSNTEGCFSVFKSSWLAAKIIIKENGENLFFNKFNDTLLIKTKALLNASWACFSLADSTKIIATVINVDTLSFLGLTDSVKTISFQAFNNTMDEIELGINNVKFLLSKNYGLIKVSNLHEFPLTQFYSALCNYEESAMAYDLIGLSNPQVGIKNLKWFEVYDYQVGDEFHIYDMKGFVNNKTHIHKYIFKYLERIDYGLDSIVYTVDREYTYDFIQSDTTTFSYIHDTVSEVILPNALFDEEPLSPYLYASENSELQLKQYHLSNDGNSKFDNGYCENFANEFHEDTTFCAFQIVKSINSSNLIGEQMYRKSFGGPFYDDLEIYPDDFLVQKRALKYYKRIGVESGEPFDLNSNIFSPLAQESGFTLYPNPANDFVYIKTPGRPLGQSEVISVELFDIYGKILFKELFEVESEIKMDLSVLQSGVYFVRVNGVTKKLSKK